LFNGPVTFLRNITK